MITEDRAVYRAASNENLFGVSAQVTTSLQRALANIYRYPDPGATLLREAIAAKLHITPDEVMVGSGSAELISLLIRVFCRPFLESAVLSVAPTYPLYQAEAEALGVQYTVAPLNSSFHFDIDSLLAKVTPQTRLCFISNPNNPTGTCLTQAQLVRLLHELPPQVILVLDEAYIEFAAAPDIADALPLLEQRPNLVVLRTFSKAYGLASLRVGYMLASRELLRQVALVKQPYTVNQLAQVAAQTALQDEDFLHQTLQATAAGKAHLQELLDFVGVQWWPSEGNFVLADAGTPAQPIVAQLLQQGVLVRETSDAHAFRITIGPKDHQDYLYRQLQTILAPEAVWEHPALAQILRTGYTLAQGNAAASEEALHQLASVASSTGSPEERIALAFARAFHAKLAADENVYAGNLYSSTFGAMDMISAFGVLIRQTPLVTFGHLFSNLAILEATANSPEIHILDLGIGAGLQWLHLLEMLASRAGGAPKVRITGVDIPAAEGAPESRLIETGERLQQHAAQLGINFSYTYLAGRLEDVYLQDLYFAPSETLVANAAFTLHHLPDQLLGQPDQRDRVLQQLKQLQPKIFTLTEPDSEHNNLHLVPRLRESLRHYYTVFDVLDTVLPPQLPERQVIEQEFFGREIINVISCEGTARVERHERNAAWQRRLTRTGFSPFALTMLPLQLVDYLQLHENFTLVENGAGYSLCWKGTPVVAATAWVSATSL
ncbi:histidinol-phosphate transaminase [Pontibacter sp. 172403-2]|uniref:histidinol-phosphate transaminase n=1 Tax=Pontibacter rufus TaxID=2791028 RepID=UPI0018AFCF77|nr:histidinol-phosphate transaminase [Pontibacter sp. 172403-2]MBF9252805.1 histidinol-phosphate transaminase [Pontibacter sp. 172403-2]